MADVPKKFSFIRTTLALWAANLFAGRAGAVTDAPMGGGSSEAWGWFDGSAWRFSARLPWAVGHHAFQHASISSIWEALAGTRFGRGVYFDGSAFRYADSVSAPTICTILNGGGLTIETASAPPVKDAQVTTLAIRFTIGKEGGIGAFGVSAPTSRPTVNAACTDLATCIALTNQIRTHLIACGLVQ